MHCMFGADCPQGDCPLRHPRGWAPSQSPSCGVAPARGSRRANGRGLGAADPHGLYERLGVSPEATAEELRAGYRRAALRTHPDKGGDVDEFRGVAAAWEVLGDEEKRAQYDATGARPGESGDPFGVFARFARVFAREDYASFFGDINDDAAARMERAGMTPEFLSQVQTEIRAARRGLPATGFVHAPRSDTWRKMSNGRVELRSAGGKGAVWFEGWVEQQEWEWHEGWVREVRGQEAKERGVETKERARRTKRSRRARGRAG